MVNLKSKMNNLTELEQIILQQWPSTLDGHLSYCLGLSGGVDSVVLLHILHKIAKFKNIQFQAIHVNHGISPNAQKWSLFCQNLCTKLAIPLTISNLQVSKLPGQGLENTARKYRYQEYASTQAQVIILAHHQDDQIETMLSQLMRGSDLHNMAGMKEISHRQKQILWRPLLTISKNKLINYAVEHHLLHIEDESNQDNQYLRNFLRNKIIPQLEAYDPHITAKLSNTIYSLQDGATLNDELAANDLIFCGNQEMISLNKFKQLNHLRQLNLLNYFIRQQQLPLTNKRQLNEFIRQALTAAPDRHPSLKLATDTYLSRIKDSICIINN